MFADIKDQFHLNKYDVHCNPGSFGVTPKSVLKKRLEYLSEWEAETDKLFFHGHARSRCDANLTKVAQFMGSNPDNLVFVENPTTGINSVVNSLNLTSNDVIVMASHAFEGVNNTMHALAERYGAPLHIIDIPWPIQSEDQIVEEFVKACSTIKNVKLVLLDWISCPSGLLFPIQKIIEALKPYQPMILLDGAHAPGQVAYLDLENIGVDFFVGCLHKWCYATVSTAVLWVHPKHQAWIKPHMASIYYKKTYKNDFFWFGSSDMTRYFCAADGLDFYKRIGGHKVISKHISEMLDFWERLLIDSFDVKPAPIPPSMRAPFMRLVELPKSKLYPEMSGNIAKELMGKLAYEYGVIMNIQVLHGKAYIRLSANVHNSKQDYIKMRDSLAKALDIQVLKDELDYIAKEKIQTDFIKWRRAISREG